MPSYRLVTYEKGQGPRAGIVVGDAIVDIAEGTGRMEDATTLALFADWANAKGRLSALAASTTGKSGLALSSVKLLAPILYPGAIYCAGANYTDHVLEMARAQNIPPEPDPHSIGLKAWHFIKTPSCVTGPDHPVHLPRRSKKVDWEAELAVVIGKTATNVPVEKAVDYVAGYTIGNDLSARDFTKREQVPDASPFKFDWVAHKCFDGSCPLGPWIVPAEDIADPQKLAIALSVNDVVKQQSNTSAMIFTVAEQIAHLSAKVTLRPGDVILTGTPAGCGTPKGEFLAPGDIVRVTVENIGELVNAMR